MSFSQALARNIKNIWNHGDDDDDYVADDNDASDVSDHSPSSYSTYRNDKLATTSSYSPTYGGGSSGSVRRLKPVASPLRSREKNIYTLKPTSVDEAAIAADYLKTGSAVVLNLETVDRANSVRIIDFMSGVCYGLDGQGHAMKLGETIFLFTPNDFEISSDETDYGENTDFFFKDVDAAAVTASSKAPVDSGWATPSSSPAPSSAFPTAERRAWER